MYGAQYLTLYSFWDNYYYFLIIILFVFKVKNFTNDKKL